MAAMPQPRPLSTLIGESFQAAISTPIAFACLLAMSLLQSAAALFAYEEARELHGIFSPWIPMLVALLAAPLDLLALTALAQRHLGVRARVGEQIGRAFSLLPAYVAWSLFFGFLNSAQMLLLGTSFFPFGTAQHMLGAAIVIEGAGVRWAWRALLDASRFQAFGTILALAMPWFLHPLVRWISTALLEIARALPYGGIPETSWSLMVAISAFIGIPVSLFMASWSVGVILDGLVRELAAKERMRSHHDRSDARPGG